MQDAYTRTCSHFSTRSTKGIPEGTVLRTVLTGIADVRCCTLWVLTTTVPQAILRCTVGLAAHNKHSGLAVITCAGTDMYEDSWFQLEGAAWRPFRHPLDAVRHAFNFLQYKLRRSQVSVPSPSREVTLGGAQFEDPSRARAGFWLRF